MGFDTFDMSGGPVGFGLDMGGVVDVGPVLGFVSPGDK